MMEELYAERGWDTQTSRPSDDRLRTLNLEYAINRIGT